MNSRFQLVEQEHPSSSRGLFFFEKHKSCEDTAAISRSLTRFQIEEHLLLVTYWTVATTSSLAIPIINKRLLGTAPEAPMIIDIMVSSSKGTPMLFVGLRISLSFPFYAK